MSFSEEQFVNKLNTLEDSQESIASASKWLLSQYREAQQVADCWKNYMLRKNVNTRRKLLAIYLTNHVVQQAKAKKIGQFQIAFGSVAAEVLKDVYPDLPRDLKRKVKRVADIWAERGIFSKEVLKNIQISLKSESGSTNAATLPPNLKEVADSYGELAKFDQNKKAIKSRFDKALEALDPSSAVYEENLKTVTKIGQSAKDAASQSITLRERRVENLKEILKEEERLLDEERNIVSEIDMMLRFKDHSDTHHGSNDEDVLPSYEAGNDDDEDEDSSSDSSSDSNENGKDSGSLKGTKRQNEVTSSDEHDNKRPKLSVEETNENDQETYEPQNLAPDQTDRDFEGAPTVTSSIQDLLSKLAN